MNIVDINSDKVMEIIKSVADDKIRPRFQKLAEEEISAKTSPSDLVTIADIEAEEELDRHLTDLLPGSIALGEEAISRGEKSIESLADTEGTYWVIDPVDGTNNFAHGRPVFGTMVALTHNGETIRSWIYDIPGEREVMAEKGAGTLKNGNAIKIPDNTKPLEDIRGYISVKFAPQPIKDIVAAKQDEIGSTNALMCCAHEYLNILDQESLYAVYTRTKPWDHLAGTLIINEAGGHHRRWDEGEYGPHNLDGGILASSDKALWDVVHKEFLADFIKEHRPHS